MEVRQIIHRAIAENHIFSVTEQKAQAVLDALKEHGYAVVAKSRFTEFCRMNVSDRFDGAPDDKTIEKMWQAMVNSSE